MLWMWFQYCKADFYNLISQAVVKATAPVLIPLRKRLPTFKNIDLASIAFITLPGIIKVPKSAVLLEKGELNRYKQVFIPAPKQIPEQIRGLIK